MRTVAPPGIAILTCGIELLKWVTKQLSDEEWGATTVFDCRNLKKVDGKVGHSEDYQFDNTQM